jgi:hypothetical protein
MSAERDRQVDGGYIAMMFAVLVPMLFAIAAIVIDVGNWYSTAAAVQRAADAAALGGVPYMPADFSSASTQALNAAAQNGWSSSATTTITPSAVSGQPSELMVTITTKVTNSLGQFFGMPTETITRSAIASYQAPLAMGSPCNDYGNAPNTGTSGGSLAATNCTTSSGFWGNVGSYKALKSYGDAYQDGNCSNGISDNCSGTNSDLSSNGYYYTVTLTHAVANLQIQAFDPSFAYVGDTCTATTIAPTSGSQPTAAKNDYNYSWNTGHTATTAQKENTNLYQSGASNAYCTGDQLFSDVSPQTPPDTTFTIRNPTSTSNAWDPTTFPVNTACQATDANGNVMSGVTNGGVSTFTGFNGDLFTALDEYNTNGTVKAGYKAAVAATFRQWVTLCTISNAQPGTYFIQIQTNAANDNANGDGHNRFSLRATSGNTSTDTTLSISGYTFMGIYANLPSADTTFYLTRVPSAAQGQILDLRFFDIGDSNGSGTITVHPPSDSNVGAFSNCTGLGVTVGALTGCSIPANSSYNGKWQTIQVPIPANYSCNDSSSSGCWVTLEYNYGAGNQPSDTTSWSASIEGSPVRITQ